MKQLLLFFFLSTVGFAQKTFFVKDKLTNEPIAYTSVYSENGKFKVNSEEDGSFIIPDDLLNDAFTFDAVGYETIQERLTSASTITSIFYLEPKSELLDEVVIISMKQTKTLKFGQVKKSNFSYGTNAIAQTWSFGRFFPYEKNMKDTPFLKEVKFYLRSEQKESTYGIRFYETDKEGFPVKLLHDELIVGKAKKGTKISTTDLRDYKILIPENGLLIVFEWINIKENYYEYSYVFEGKKHLNKSYNPSLLAVPINDYKQSFIKYRINNDEWKLMNTENTFFKERISKPYSIISCELTLTN